MGVSPGETQDARKVGVSPGEMMESCAEDGYSPDEIVVITFVLPDGNMYIWC